jgi:hypothetical protein
MRRSVLLLSPLLVMAAGRAGRAESWVPPPGAELDLLVVVDSSPAMAEERAALAPALGALVEQVARDLESDHGVGLSLHVGLVTADLGAGPHALPGCVPGGDGGRLRAVASGDCAGPTGAFVVREVDEWGGEIRNFEGELGDAVACIVPRELDGCVVQQPMAAARLALDGTVTDNIGFLRPTAALAILVVSNQEDCSAADAATFFDPASGAVTSYRCAAQGWTCTPPIDGTPQSHTGCYPAAGAPLIAPFDLTSAVSAVKSEPWRIAVGVLRGPAEPVHVTAGPAIAPSCGAGAPIAASPALRIDAFAGLFAHAWLGDLCGGDLNPFRDAIYAAIHDPGPAPDGDAGVGWCDGGWSDTHDAGDEGGFPFGGGGGCSAGGGGGLGAALILLGLLRLLARGAQREQRLAVDL